MGGPIGYICIFTILWIVLCVCAFFAIKTKKKIGKSVALLDISLALSIISNILISASHDRNIVNIGYYGYYISMNFAIAAMVKFTNDYCQGVNHSKTSKKRKPTVMYALLGLDVIQLSLGFVFNHVFILKANIKDNIIHYDVIPKLGLVLHRIIDYIVFLAILLIFGLAIKATTKVLREKFVVIFVALVLAALAQTYFIIVHSTVNGSMLTYGLLGISIFHYAIVYKPVKLLDRLLSVIASNMDDAIFAFDPSGNPVWMNTNAEKLVGTSDVNKAFEVVLDIFGDIRNRGDNWNEDVIRVMNGEDRYLSLEKKSIHSNVDLLDGSFLVVRDATERHKRVEQMIYAANHDELTGIYSKKHLLDVIQDRLLEPDKNYYIVYVNVKNFKLVNDVFGNAFGDEVLIRVANWFRNHLSKDCVYGRLTADHFGVLIPVDEFDRLTNSDNLSEFIIRGDDIEHQIFIHLGVYRVIDKAVNVSAMFDRARLALSTATDNYTTCIRYYDDNLRAEVLREQQVIMDFKKAIENDEILPYLQPISDLNGKIVGAEALARWIHPEKGFLSPISFIPIFEKNGVIVDVDKHIWECACKILASWKGKYDDMFVSINISPKDFYFIDVLEELTGLVKKYDIQPKNLRVEITETALLDDSEERVKIFQRLRKAGFIVEMDDFGSGYSSLNMLKDVSVDILKIDMKFLSNDSEKSDTIIKNVIRLSNELNITALTEGVETEQQFKQLIDMGCSLFQGYYFAKPMPVDEFETFVKNNQ